MKKRSNEKVLNNIRKKYLEIAKMDLENNVRAGDFSYQSSVYRATSMYGPSKIYHDGNSYKSAYSV
jgi:hypothetical protein